MSVPDTDDDRTETPADERAEAAPPARTEETADASEAADRLDAATRIELLTAENRRLRAQYARVRQSRYRKTAAGLVGLGVLAAVAGLVLPDGREVLFSLAATGLFGGLLTYYLTPSQFVAADIGDRVYTPIAENYARIVAELGLRDDRVYYPGDGVSPARLFVPAYDEYERPEDDGPIVTEGQARGLVLEPTGDRLFEAFEQAVSGGLATEPEPLAAQLADGLVEQFELAGTAEPDVDAAAGRITVAITDSVFGDVDRFDNPIASFLAVGIATGLDRPVRLEVAKTVESRAEWLVTCRFEPDAD